MRKLPRRCSAMRKHASSLVVHVAVAALALAAIPAWAAELEPPSEIAVRFEQIRRLRQENKLDAVAELSAASAEAIYQWTADALRHNTGASVIAALSQVLPVVQGEMQMSAQEREAMIYNRREDVIVSVAAWRGPNREAVAMRVDQRSADSHRRENEQYLVSRRPVLFAKDGDQIAVGDLETVEEPHPARRWAQTLWSVYTLIGFIEPPDPTTWPDLLISRGPDGQGQYITMLQFHADPMTHGQWQLVWESDGYAWGRSKLDSAQRVLEACWSDRDGDGDCDRWRLRHGFAPTNVVLPEGARDPETVRRALGGIPSPEPLSAELTNLLRTPPSSPGTCAPLTSASRIIGRWTLVSYVEDPVAPGAKRTPRLNLLGTLDYKESGTMTIRYTTDRTSSPGTYTKETSGRYSIDPAARTVTYHFEKGDEPPRSYEMTDDDTLVLRWTKPVLLGGERVTETWSRDKTSKATVNR